LQHNIVIDLNNWIVRLMKCCGFFHWSTASRATCAMGQWGGQAGGFQSAA
jgi:hypothetical protein